MTAEPREERCIDCDEPTGRAGAGDDSIYTDDGDGPLCEDCYGKRQSPRPIGHCPECGFAFYYGGGYCGGCRAR